MTIRQAGSDDEISEIATDLEDLKTNVEELQTNSPPDIDPGALDRVKGALEDAIDPTDELEEAGRSQRSTTEGVRLTQMD